MKNLPEFPRYEEVYRKACEFIISQPVALLPADPFRLISENRWGLVSYRQLAQKTGIPVDSLIASLQSPDGCTLYNGSNYCIAYNNDVAVFGRVVFTLFHEIGHIVLGHFNDFDRGLQAQGGVRMLNSAKYRVLENEASYFASNVMAPSVVIERCELKTVGSLRIACGMSYDAAETRLLHFKHWVPTELDQRVQQTMLEYIRVSHRPRLSMRSVEVWRDELPRSLSDRSWNPEEEGWRHKRVD
ncbi:MAG: ImmA/IrrE family metallo-endopeptidase [Clostridia bacterium]|nr:ImmA/IrrE family metallo-endopeptidase [Clostridia bacterium]